MSPDTGSRVLGTTAKSIEVLELLDEMDGARVSELADRMEKPPSTVHGHLATLESKEFVFKRGDIYYLGPELLRLGNQVRTRKDEFVLARQFTEKMCEETGFRSTFAVEMGGKAAFIHSASGSKVGWAHEQMGNRLYLHNTAVGKAILAEMPKHRIELILDKWGLPRETERTITDEEAFFEELEAVRERGYAVNRGENIEGLYAVGVAATKQSGELIGGFSISGPEHALTDDSRESRPADVVREIVDEYELEVSLSR
jgi:DNA-binding IclR family transcriptional regulator